MKKYLLVACLACAPSAWASDWDWTVQAGASQNGGNQHDTTPVGFVGAVGPAKQWRKVSIEPVVSIGYVQGRDDVGNKDDVWLAGGGARWRLNNERWNPLFVETLVYGTHGSTNALSGNLQFGTAIGWSWEHVDVMVRHISNARIKEPNDGETMLLVGVTF